MTIAELEWFLIALAAVVLILWKVEDLPRLARALGQARTEFARAADEFTKEFSDAEPHHRRRSERGPEYGFLLGKQLGIQTEGKTREEIARELKEKIERELGQGLPNPRSAEDREDEDHGPVESTSRTP